MSKRKWMLVFLFFMFLVGGVVTYLFMKATSFKYVEIEQTNEALGIQNVSYEELVVRPSYKHAIEKNEQEANQWENQIINIALFGVDRRRTHEQGRSDSIIVLTVDFKHGKIKLTSLMRDLEVLIEGYGKTKLNHAYAYGGAPLAIKTINQNLGLDIRDYAAVDFYMLAAIIDTIGGVDIDIKPEEIRYINKYIKEIADIENKEPIYLERSGYQTLNGMQAVAYARIRSVGNGDFERTGRQRQVLIKMIEKLKNKGVAAIPGLMMELSPYVETSLNRSDLLSMAYQYFKHGNMAIEQKRFPLDGTWKSGHTKAGGWVIQTDLDKLKSVVQQYIYDDQLSTTPTMEL